VGLVPGNRLWELDFVESSPRAALRPDEVAGMLRERKNSMAQFTVRVELHQAQWDDYEKLHSAMGRQGFSRLIRSDDGKTYQLPWAEYNGSGNLSSSQVRDIARAAADSTGKSNAVLVSESQSRSWIGLEQV
jgi:hypothetical protein